MMRTDSITRITEFIKPGSTIYLATAEDNTPFVRPFQFQFEKDGRLWFCTANTKDVFHHLQKNPKVEFTFVSPEYVTMRVSGSIVISEDSTVKQKIISENDLVGSIYKEAENPIFSVFFLEHGSVRISYLTGDPEERFHF